MEAAQISVFMAFFPVGEAVFRDWCSLRALPDKERDPADVRKPGNRDTMSPHACLPTEDPYYPFGTGE